jgi:penicillin-binding protein 1A
MSKAKRGENQSARKTRGRVTAARVGAIAALAFSHIMSAAIWVGLLAAAGIIYLALDLPKIDESVLTRRPNIRLIDTTGWEIASFGDIYGNAVDLTKVPKYVPAAVVAVEDRRFYQHPGIDIRGLARAMVTNVKAGRTVQGGSTITQQVAKNLFLTSDRTLIRKVREALLALKLERAYTKDQILTLYMNRVYFGGGAYGFEAASERFFGHPAQELSIYESAILAGLLKAPSHYNPSREPERARLRAGIVLGTMVETGAITQAEADTARKGATRTLKAVVPPSSRGKYFADWVVTQVDSYVGTIDRDIVVETTLDGRLQAAAEDALEKNLAKSGAKLNVEQGAIVVLGTDGAVRTMVGGRDYNDSQFNRATQALRQPGSAFKPFVYLTAIESGMRPDDLVADAPIKIGKWKPQNFDGKYLGNITVETALMKSINTVAVRLAQQVGPQAIISTAHRMGIGQKMKPDLSLALGSGEVTLLELTGAYTPFANGGDAVLPYAILKIKDRGGNVLYTRQSQGLERVVDIANVATMDRMMAQVLVQGTGTAAAFGYPAAGKTGTSSDFRDAWFMGFTADYVAGVWVGNDNSESMKKVTGGGLPAQIWREVMTAAHINHEPRWLPGLEPPEPQQEQDLLSRLWRVFSR